MRTQEKEKKKQLDHTSHHVNKANKKKIILFFSVHFLPTTLHTFRRLALLLNASLNQQFRIVK